MNSESKGLRPSGEATPSLEPRLERGRHSPEESRPTFDLLEKLPLLRREAGEGWHKKGLNYSLLGALVAREVFIDDMTQKGIRPTPESEESLEAYPDDSFSREQESVRTTYRNLVADIDYLKKAAGIGSPPPESPETIHRERT